MFVSRSLSHELQPRGFRSSSSPAAPPRPAPGAEGTVHYHSADSTEAAVDPKEWMPVQDFLQGHFIEAMGRVAAVLRDEPNVLGFDTLNEPDYGYIGRKDLSTYLPSGGPEGAPKAFTLSGHESMLLASGLSKKRPISCDFFEAPWTFRKRLNRMNKAGVSLWKRGFKCVWAAHGVYDATSGELLRKDYFRRRPGSQAEVEVTHDYLVPFWFKMQRRIRHELGERALLFCSPFAFPFGQERQGYAVDLDLYRRGGAGTEPLEVEVRACGERGVRTVTKSDQRPQKPSWGCIESSAVWTRYSPENMVYAGHYYEGLQLFYAVFLPWVVTKLRSVWLGRGLPVQVGTEESTINCMAIDLWTQMEFGRPLGPSILGEIGIEMHIAGERARSKTYERKMRALERGRVNGYTLWNYTPDTNTYDTALLGDGFNGESLSIWAREEKVKAGDIIFNGGRALGAVVRPSPFLVGGRLRQFGFEGLTQRREFFLLVEETGRCSCKTTEIFVPYYQYGGSFAVEVSGGTWEADVENQKLVWKHADGCGEGFVHKLRMWKK